jgi:hypothetical protein
MKVNRLKQDITLLPDNILLNIFNYLPSNHLYRLALLCRRLHHLALPHYLFQHGIHDPMSLIELTVQTHVLDALSGLRIALFIPNTARLVCHFPQLDTADFFRNLFRLNKLVTRLNVVEHITLGVRNWMYNLSFTKDRFQREAWNVSFEELCMTLAAKSCSSLELVNLDDGDRRNYTPSRGNRTGAGVQRFRGAIRRMINMRWELREWQVARSSKVMNTTQERFALTSTHIRSPNIFDPLHLEQVLPTLSSLQSLTLACSEIRGSGWTNILTQITHNTPSLSTVTISTLSILPDDLLQFVGQLLHLTHLTLPASMQLLPQKYSIHTRPKLLSLTSLSASPNYISALLSFEQSLPNIQSLEICLPNLTHLNSTQSAETITRILQRLPDIRRSVSTSLKIFAGGEVTVKGYMMRNLDTSLRMGPDYDASFALITSVTIADLAPFRPSDVELYSFVFPEWLALFRAMRHLKCTGYSSPSPYIFLRSARACSLNLFTVTVNHEVYEASAIDKLKVDVGSTRASTFLDLPDDILHIIFEELTIELFSLASLSRRLKLLALPVYLNHRGMPNPTTFSKVTLTGDVYGSMADISALRLSHSVSAIQHLHCTVADNTSLYVVFCFIRRLRSLVFSLASVEKFTLEFTINGIQGETNGIVLSKWRDLLGSFLEVIIKRHCVALAVQRGLFFTHALVVPQLPLQADASIADSRRTSLTTLAIDSEILLRPPLLSWTIQTLQHSKITHLKLTSLSYSISELLPCIASLLPSLTDLHIGGRSLRPVDAMAFINGLPQLRSLSMCRSLSEDHWEPNFFPESNPTLNLTKLSAPPQFITFLLSNPTILPNIRFLAIVLRTSWYPVAFLSHMVKRLEQFNASPTIAFDIPLIYISHLDERANSLLAEDARWGNPSAIVTSLILSGYHRASVLSPSIPFVWLSLFPNLLHLTVEEPLPEPALAPTMAGFIDGCPSLVTLHMNGLDRLIARS